MKRHVFFIFLVCAVIGVKAQRPNVVLIVTDDQGSGEVAAHGNNKIRTPEMDKL